MPFEKGKASVFTTKKAKQARDIAVVFRENLHPQVMFDWLMAIMAGHNAVIEPHKSSEYGYKIAWPEHEIAPTLDVRFKAMQMLAERTWGLPVNKIQLEGELRSYALTLTADASDIQNVLTYEMRQKILEAITGQTTVTSDPIADAIDVTPGDTQTVPHEVQSGNEEDNNKTR